MYSERYQEFQKAIQQSSQMVTSCHKEIEKMGKRIKVLEKERDDYRHRSSTHEQSVQKLTQDVRKISLGFLRSRIYIYNMFSTNSWTKRNDNWKRNSINSISYVELYNRNELSFKQPLEAYQNLQPRTTKLMRQTNHQNQVQTYQKSCIM